VQCLATIYNLHILQLDNGGTSLARVAETVARQRQSIIEVKEIDVLVRQRGRLYVPVNFGSLFQIDANIIVESRSFESSSFESEKICILRVVA
jgi:hypothetical protein